MRVVHHTSGKALLRHAGTLLEAAEVENGLLLGICGLASEGSAPGQLWLSVDTNSGPVAVALCTPPFNLAISRAPVDVLEALVSDLGSRTLHPCLPGVIGPAESARDFADLWARRRGIRTEVTMRQGIYELTHLVPPSPCAGGELRGASLCDTDLVSGWMAGFGVDARLPVAEREPLRHRAQALAASGNLFIWEDAGTPVSMAALQGQTAHGVRISLVYTPPTLRGRGYASACVSALSARALAAGRRFCMLYTDLSNSVSNGIYQRIGYRLLCESATIVFSEASTWR